MDFGALFVVGSLISLALCFVYKLVRYALQTVRLYMLYRMRIQCAALSQCSEPEEPHG